MAVSSASADGVLPSGVRPLRADDPCRIGGHRLLGRLGAGGMGVVYLGEDPLGGFVAVKTAHADPTGGDEPRRRLMAEAACVGRVPGAFTARLLADGTARTPPYIVIDYIEGRSLADVVTKDGPLPPEQLHALAVGLGRALTAIHSAGVVHRDLKPPNVLLTPTGPRLIDFGIAQEVPAVGGPTGPGMVVGSPGWIAPERLDRRPATPASDVFGWGCLVAYAATGRNPFGEGDRDTLARRVMLEPPDLEGLDGRLRSLVDEALAKDPAERPSAADLLGPARGSGVPEASARPRRWTRSDPAARLPAAELRRPVRGSRTSEASARRPWWTRSDRAARSSSPGPTSGSGTQELPARRRWPVLALAAAALVAVAGVVVAVAGGGHHARSVPPAGVVSTTPPPGNQAATRGVLVPRPRAGRPTAAPHASPRVVTTPPAQGKAKKQKGKGKGGGGPGKQGGRPTR